MNTGRARTRLIRMGVENDREQTKQKGKEIESKRKKQKGKLNTPPCSAQSPPLYHLCVCMFERMHVYACVWINTYMSVCIVSIFKWHFWWLARPCTTHTCRKSFDSTMCTSHVQTLRYLIHCILLHTCIHKTWNIKKNHLHLHIWYVDSMYIRTYSIP